jgi:hypothetical protein
MDERKKVVSRSSIDRGGYVGRLVAFVDMKVDEHLNDDKTLLEINTAFVVYKIPLTTEPGKRVT